MRKQAKGIGLAIVGAGRVGMLRGAGAAGDVTLVTSRAFRNRLAAIDNYKRPDDPSTISPMVISGTHALDIVMWCMEARTPVECYARSIERVLGPISQGIDATAGM